MQCATRAPIGRQSASHPMKFSEKSENKYLKEKKGKAIMNHGHFHMAFIIGKH